MTKRKADKLRRLNIELKEEIKNLQFWKTSKKCEITDEMIKHYEKKVKKVQSRVDRLGGIPEELED